MSGLRTERGWICLCKGSMSAIYPRQHTMTKGKKGETSRKYWSNPAAQERDAAPP